MLSNNATVGHCVVCGMPDKRQLCRTCRVQWSVDGRVPEWLRVLRLEQVKQAQREQLNQLRVAQRPAQRKRRRGRPFNVGVSFVRLEAIKHLL